MQAALSFRLEAICCNLFGNMNSTDLKWPYTKVRVTLLLHTLSHTIYYHRHIHNKHFLLPWHGLLPYEQARHKNFRKRMMCVINIVTIEGSTTCEASLMQKRKITKWPVCKQTLAKRSHQQGIKRFHGEEFRHTTHKQYFSLFLFEDIHLGNNTRNSNAQVRGLLLIPLINGNTHLYAWGGGACREKKENVH